MNACSLFSRSHATFAIGATILAGILMDAEPRRDHRTDATSCRMLVLMRTGAAPNELSRELAAPIRFDYYHQPTGICEIRVPRSHVAALNGSALVRGVAAPIPIALCRAEVKTILQDAEDAVRNWHLEKLQAEEAWRVTTGSPTVKVAVVDTGLSFEHDTIKRNPNIKDGLRAVDKAPRLLPSGNAQLLG